MLDDYEMRVEEWEARHRRCAAAVRGEETLFQVTHEVTAFHIASIQGAALSARIVNLANGQVALLNSRNVYSAPVVARALFEACAVPLYMRRNLLPRVEKGRVDQVHRMLYRLGLGTLMDIAHQPWKPIPVKSLIKAMADEIGDVMGDVVPEDRVHIDALGITEYGEAIQYGYSILSELTHPNQPAMTPASGQDAQGYTTWTLQPEVNERVAGFSVRPTWYSMLAGGIALDQVLEQLETRGMVLPDSIPEFPADELKGAA